MQKEVVCPSCPPSRYVASATAVDNSAPLQVVQVPTYKSGFVVQTNAATSVVVKIIASIRVGKMIIMDFIFIGNGIMIQH